MNEAPLDAARRGYACWEAGDYDGMLELATPDFEFVPAIAASVEGGSIRGHDAFRRFFADLDETWETFRISADDFREAGGRVMSIGRLTAKGRGSELELDQPIYTVLWFRGDRIARMQSFLEESAAQTAFKESTPA
jgi:ketosteroid isomerase-like protein